MTEEELRALYDRDAPTGKTYDRDLLGAIATTPDYMVGGRFIPTDYEQAEDALKTGGYVVLWRGTFGTPDEERRMRDRFHRLSLLGKRSINEIWNDTIQRGFDLYAERLPPHQLAAMLRSMPDKLREEALAKLPPHKRPKMSDDV